MYAVDFTWGDTVKTDITKKEVDKIIQNYVNTKYPQKVKKYHFLLNEQKEKSIQEVNKITFIHDNLMWQDSNINNEMKLNRLELKVYCRKLDFANRKDWRVPLFSELITLIDYQKTMPASIDKINFIDSSKYWTSSVSKLEKNKNWFVDFTDGTTGVDSDLTRHNIRCVRTVSTVEGKY